MAFDPEFFEQVFPGTPPPQGGPVPLDTPLDHIARTTRDPVLAVPTALQWEGRNIPFLLFIIIICFVLLFHCFPFFWVLVGPEE